MQTEGEGGCPMRLSETKAENRSGPVHRLQEKRTIGRLQIMDPDRLIHH